MNEIPPSFASAIASLSPETACITADVSGMFMLRGGSSTPFLNFVIGVLRLTFSTLHSFDEYPGIRRYSLNVLEGSVKICTVFPPFLLLKLIIYKHKFFTFIKH